MGGAIIWAALAIFLLNCGFHRVGFSMLFPIAAPFLLWNWCRRKRDKLPTDTFDSLNM